jgi:hypothetical protein
LYVRAIAAESRAVRYSGRVKRLLIALAACSTPASSTTPTLPGDRVATLRIGSVLGGRPVVWLESDHNTPLVIDDFPLPQWAQFQDQRVVVTGECYASKRPAAHFAVQTLRVVGGTGPFIALGPARLIEGAFGVPGVFEAADGTAYQLVGPLMFDPPIGRSLFVVGREMERTVGRHLWVLALHDGMHEVVEPTHIACPR